MAWYHRAWNVLRPGRSDRELERELAFHLAERTDDLMERGFSPEDAAHEARRRFGNRTMQAERAHTVNTYMRIESVFSDVRYALRGLRASPGFAATAILSLALGIGANTAIFSLTNALVYKSLPVSHPEQLVHVAMVDDKDPATSVTLNNDAFTNPLWEQLRDQTRPFAASFASATTTFNLANGGESRRANGEWVTGAFFSVLGVRSVAGRLIGEADDQRGCSGVAAVSQGFAEREFGSAALAPGKIISLNRHPTPIVGVVDPAFFGMNVGRTVDVYVPLCAQAIHYSPKVLDARSRWYLNIILRPREGVSNAQLKARLAAVTSAVYAATVPPNFSINEQRDYQKTKLAVGPAASGLSDLRARYQPALLMLMVLVGVVLLIACANIANLLLARAAARQREVAIRLAIGASRWRVVRQSLTESLLLSFLGATLGIFFARWASQLLVGFLSARGRSVWLDLSLDGRVLAFTIGLATITAILFGIVPAWRTTRVDAQATLKSGGRGLTTGDSRQRIAKSLVVLQVALSLALVATSGLLLGSFRKLITLDPGFQREGVLLVNANFANLGYQDAALNSVKTDVLNRLRTLPGVVSASASALTPIGNMSWNDFVGVAGYSPTSANDSLAFFNQVSDGFFTTFGTTIVAGRAISAEDVAQSRRVAVINQTMAKQFFGTANPIGRTFRVINTDSAPPSEVVGIARDAKYQRLDEKTLATAYFPMGEGDVPPTEPTFAIRTTGLPTSLIPSVRSIMASVNPAIPLDIRTLATQVDDSLIRPRLLATLSGFFGTLAILVAVLGLYGTMSYNVARRRNEIGIRIALGAAHGRVLRMVVGEAGRLIGLGIALGGALAFVSTRLVSTLLYGVTPRDPVTFALSAAGLGGIAVLAAVLPAMRAARVEPMEALREE